MHRTATIHGLVLISGLALAAGTQADTPESDVIFTRRIAPLLREKCIACHGQNEDEIEGGLDLRTSVSSTSGGDSEEPGIVPGKPESSSIFLAAARGEDMFSAMPPKEAERLSEQQLTWLREWIEAGATWPTKDEQAAIQAKHADAWSVEDGIAVRTSGGLSADWTNRKYDPAGLWAYQPIKEESFRNVVAAMPDRSPVDLLLEQAMPKGLDVAPRADRKTLIRRATFDLIGLPPTIEEVEAFERDPVSDEDAFATVINRLLESPHYGERMAQHWLDVTRYADSAGFANDYERGNAWRYRDYVIRAFNDDKPYDKFIREQIAGDELDQTDSETIVATGFLRMGPWELTMMEVPKIARQRFLDDVTNAVGETFLGHSLQCCRCHDHKFDPIPTRDYYSIQAVFATTQLAERRAAFQTEENTEGFEERDWLLEAQVGYERTIRELDTTLLENASQWLAKNDIAPEAWNDAVQRAKRTAKPGRVFGLARFLMSKDGAEQESYPPVNVGFSPQQFGMHRVANKGRERLQWELERYEPFALAVYSGRTPSRIQVQSPLRIPDDPTGTGELENTSILSGGDPFSPTQAVEPGVLSVIETQVSAAIPDTIQGRRKAFANWVADRNNPLTSRVLANRIWMWHFGNAIAGNPNNFGASGKRPTHPALLDWLSAELTRGHWSIKHLHRQIMTSDAYCRSTNHPDPEALSELDPKGTSYAVFSPRRLSAEELRDSMLAVSGELNDALGGIPCRPLINPEVALQPRQVMGTFAAAWTPNPKPTQRNRRSIYVLKLRGLIAPNLEVFNSPSPDFSCERRDTSTITPQVFATFNSSDSQARSLALAHDLLRDGNDDDDATVRLLYQRLFSRQATDAEVQRCLAHWQKITSMLPANPTPVPNPPQEVTRQAVEENTGENFTFVEKRHAMQAFVPDLQPPDVDRQTRALADLCLVLLNSNEFIYVY